MVAALKKEQKDSLRSIAKKIATPGKGILAADESVGTIGKRFAGIKVENDEENRRAYRELLFDCKEKIEDHISGVILFEETLGHKTSDGRNFVDVLVKRGIIPGIKVDKGLVELPGTNGETTTTGLDGLAERCKKYYDLGCRFAKWRCVLKIGLNEPSQLSINENAHALARYAVICQSAGIVPIVEPEILMDGDHTLERAVEVNTIVLNTVYSALVANHVYLEGTLLKPNMVSAGVLCPVKYQPSDIAQATVAVLQRTVPVAVPGVTFLSGGQSEEDATIHLNIMNQVDTIRPWSLTFSYGRALQSTVLKVWSGKKENVAAAQAALYVRAKANGEAAVGKYKPDESVSGSAKESLYVSNYVY